MKLCDLHTHSIYSDGTYTPAQLVETALDCGLSALALTDHNTVDGLPAFLTAAEGKPIEIVAGAEFSVDYDGTELHLLGLHIPPAAFDRVSNLMQEVNARKEQSNIDLVAALNGAGYAIDYDVIKAKTPNGKCNRAHIAAALTEAGYTASVKEAFKTLLGKDCGYYVEPQRLTVWETIDFIRDIGAVPVLAHPFLNLEEDALAAFLPRAKERGLVGMECAYSLYDEETTAKSFALADANGLLYSGGSDFHGANKPHIRMGVGQGNLSIPYAWAEAIQNAKGR